MKREYEYVATVDGVDYHNITKVAALMGMDNAPTRAVLVGLRHGNENTVKLNDHLFEYKRDRPVIVEKMHAQGTPLLGKRPLGYYSLGRGEA